RGQVTFRKEVLQHLGIKPGEKIELDLLPDWPRRIESSPACRVDGGFCRPAGRRTAKVASIDEINEAAAKGWAGRK
ncbi:transcriptional regulator, AbrB, partial [mine drainage metagenome]